MVPRQVLYPPTPHWDPKSFSCHPSRPLRCPQTGFVSPNHTMGPQILLLPPQPSSEMVPRQVLCPPTPLWDPMSTSCHPNHPLRCPQPALVSPSPTVGPPSSPCHPSHPLSTVPTQVFCPQTRCGTPNPSPATPAILSTVHTQVLHCETPQDRDTTMSDKDLGSPLSQKDSTPQFSLNLLPTAAP
ncbi:hypothetical protein DV515_00017214 [Chloebia gouldiae]|uniref:Uncharacterized protein n=1 Tax=Chloebia gouldiae TaxID=44316 RepID=A0A3L8R0M3_CHLGU|nr:hypothetical protein DV515_00017216 [Chloebia gouldiae]RLV73144.1 hypothetical protein DV515_00017214 [Chloebia gouldiae]